MAVGGIRLIVFLGFHHYSFSRGELWGPLQCATQCSVAL